MATTPRAWPPRPWPAPPSARPALGPLCLSVPVNSTSPFLPILPVRSRRAAFTLSVLAAVVLNLTVLGVVAAVAATWGANPQSTRSTSWVTVVSVQPRAPATSIAAHEKVAGGAAVPVPTREPPTAEPMAPKIRPAAPSTAALTEPEAIDEPSIRYYRYGEVDEPAVPEGDWNLDTSLLDSARLGRVVFEVYVDAAGKVVGCSVLEPETIDAPTRLALEARLGEARLQPAVRHGVAVASMRTIEVSVSTVEN